MRPCAIIRDRHDPDTRMTHAPPDPPAFPGPDLPPLELLFADDTLAVVNKPAGLMAHDSKLARGESDFLADRLREQLGRPIFLVHRLDRATSGCLLLAFDRDTAAQLGQVMMARDADRPVVEKHYWAV